ncbi:acetyl-CoA carboxylase biotin carboxyl carrier protein [Paraburkholderia kirstenboschensis]|uniref:Biotin/lipoyl-containing protein n=1 Tax=Paraburkholderia kirstenboschensis TaxID=1245436 RepID=A0ABZ0EIF3_9BURK|nr:biotin/lipoyl-containing protein [Paraburkholderia kirstenboschensis]WOD17005.1 biotin/lipoyl-containing protein [Paraburkholderia kirstenboschensis]
MKQLFQSTVDELEVNGAGIALCLKRDVREDAAPKAGPAAESVTPISAGAAPVCTIVVQSPAIANFVASHPLRDLAFCRCGDTVKAGDVMGLVAYSSYFPAVTAKQGGLVKSILVRSGAVARFGDGLFEIEVVE